MKNPFVDSASKTPSLKLRVQCVARTEKVGPTRCVRNITVCHHVPCCCLSSVCFSVISLFLCDHCLRCTDLFRDLPVEGASGPGRPKVSLRPHAPNPYAPCFLRPRRIQQCGPPLVPSGCCRPPGPFFLLPARPHR